MKPYKSGGELEAEALSRAANTLLEQARESSIDGQPAKPQTKTEHVAWLTALITEAAKEYAGDGVVDADALRHFLATPLGSRAWQIYSEAIMSKELGRE